MEPDEELPNPGLEVAFLRRMEDVTSQVLKDVSPQTDEIDRYHIITEHMDEIIEKTIEDTHYEAEIKPFYYGNQYYLFVYEVFKDVRLVGAPPSSIGKFGWDTDNWIWPRHTGDFALFRIYADINNMPAEYSPDNIPYKPRKHLSISLKGIKENDFTMVIGYPGSTYQFLTFWDLKTMMYTSVPNRIKTRTIRMNIMYEEMIQNSDIMIKYASKYSRVTNSWKKWIGMLKGLERLEIIRKKENFEEAFDEWTDSYPERKSVYGDLLNKIESVCLERDDVCLANDYYSEIVMAIEIFNLASRLNDVIEIYEDETASRDEFQKTLNAFKSYVKGILEMFPEKLFYPDANLTMCITYGRVEGYFPRDAVEYECYTTLKGVMEKESQEVYDYFIPDYLEKLYHTKDYEDYGVGEGCLFALLPVIILPVEIQAVRY